MSRSLNFKEINEARRIKREKLEAERKNGFKPIHCFDCGIEIEHQYLERKTIGSDLLYIVDGKKIYAPKQEIEGGYCFKCRMLKYGKTNKGEPEEPNTVEKKEPKKSEFAYATSRDEARKRFMDGERIIYITCECCKKYKHRLMFDAENFKEYEMCPICFADKCYKDESYNYYNEYMCVFKSAFVGIRNLLDDCNKSAQYDRLPTLEENTKYFTKNRLY